MVFSKFHELQLLKDSKDWERTGNKIDFPLVYHSSKLAREFGKLLKVQIGSSRFGETILKQKWFYNEKEKRLKGFVYFPKECEGAFGQVHGGCIATVLDNALGWLSVRLVGFGCMTLYLKVAYKNVIPLNSVVQVEALVDRVENNRKFYLKCILKNATPVEEIQQLQPTTHQKDIIYAESESLFYHVVKSPTFHELRNMFGPQIENVEEIRANISSQLKESHNSTTKSKL